MYPGEGERVGRREGGKEEEGIKLKGKGWREDREEEERQVSSRV